MRGLGNLDRREMGRWLNNRAENSRLPFRRREPEPGDVWRETVWFEGNGFHVGLHQAAKHRRWRPVAVRVTAPFSYLFVFDQKGFTAPKKQTPEIVIQ